VNGTISLVKFISIVLLRRFNRKVIEGSNMYVQNSKKGLRKNNDLKYVVIFLLYVDFPSYTGLSKRCEVLINSLSFQKNVEIYVYSPVIFGPSLDLIHEFSGLKNMYVKHIRLPIPRYVLKKVFKGFFAKGVITILYSSIIFFHLLVDMRNMSSKDKKLILQYEQIILAPLAYLAKRILGGKTIADDINLLFIRFDGFKRKVLQLFEHIFLVKADIILTASIKTIAYVSKINRKVVYIQNALINIKDEQYCLEKTRRLLDKKDVNMVFVGNLTFHQNIKAVYTLYKIMFHLVEKLNVKNVKLNVIGGPLNNIPRPILDNDLVKNGYLVFHGRLAEKKKEEIYSESLIGLLPYFKDLIRWGGQMTKTLEMLSNCVILITGTEGVMEINGVDNVHFVVAKNIQEMINLLVAVINNPLRYVEIAHSGCRFVRTNNSLYAIKKKYPTILEKFFGK